MVILRCSRVEAAFFCIAECVLIPELLSAWLYSTTHTHPGRWLLLWVTLTVSGLVLWLTSEEPGVGVWPWVCLRCPLFMHVYVCTLHSESMCFCLCLCVHLSLCTCWQWSCKDLCTLGRPHCQFVLSLPLRTKPKEGRVRGQCGSDQVTTGVAVATYSESSGFSTILY